ncbi:unnamed protein product [Ilex paraguariensis]|uniref:Uncharacterized protein n=1 Tax=Ilex paraguariensis TaxID=185542 RepID=A0ABC8RE30_9AQUA
MDVQSAAFPGKIQASRPKTTRKITEAPKTNAKEPPIHGQRRVFGTARNPNVPAKTTEKPIIKPPTGVSQKQPKSVQTTPSSTDVVAVPAKETTQKSPDKIKTRPKKKSVCFIDKVNEKTERNTQDGDTVAPRTPVRSPALVKPRISGTPYLSAKRCSNCRFDRLETSTYWLSQIRLAESVGKHFISAAFFQLAFESKAEPIRNLRVELKGYLARHEYLSAETRWMDVSVKYGLLKDASNAAEVDSDLGKVGASEATGTGSIDDQEKEELKEQTAEEHETKND